MPELDAVTWVLILAAGFTAGWVDAVVGGAALASQIPADAFKPIVVAACTLVAAWTVLRPAVGLETELRYSGRRHRVLAVGTANMLGGYVGARTAVAKGSGFVRVVFLLVVTGLIVRLVVDIVG